MLHMMTKRWMDWLNVALNAQGVTCLTVALSLFLFLFQFSFLSLFRCSNVYYIPHGVRQSSVQWTIYRMCQQRIDQQQSVWRRFLWFQNNKYIHIYHRAQTTNDEKKARKKKREPKLEREWGNRTKEKIAGWLARYQCRTVMQPFIELYLMSMTQNKNIHIFLLLLLIKLLFFCSIVSNMEYTS